MAAYENGYSTVMKVAGLTGHGALSTLMNVITSPNRLPKNLDILVRGDNSSAAKRVQFVVDGLRKKGKHQLADKLEKIFREEMVNPAPLDTALGAGMLGLYGAGAYGGYKTLSEPEEDPSLLDRLKNTFTGD